MSDQVELSRRLLDATRSGSGGEWGTLVGELGRLEAASLAGDEPRIAFWLNLYNAALLEELGRRQPPGRCFATGACFEAPGWRWEGGGTHSTRSSTVSCD